MTWLRIHNYDKNSSTEKVKVLVLTIISKEIINKVVEGPSIALQLLMVEVVGNANIPRITADIHNLRQTYTKMTLYMSLVIVVIFSYQN